MFNLLVTATLLSCCLGAVVDFSSNPDEITCNYMVQIEPGRQSKQKHFHYLAETHVNLLSGVVDEWEIGQMFQGYHINLCTPAESENDYSSSYSAVQRVHLEYLKLKQAPELVTIERDDKVYQAGWVEERSDEESDEIRLMNEEEELAESNNLHIIGQQAATIACQNDATWSLHRIGYKDVSLPLPTGALNQAYPYIYQPPTHPIVYVMDTEVYLQNTQYGGRAQQVKTFIGTNETALPFPPHGSHVAGIIGAARYGAQKWSEILSVVTLSRSGTGSWVNVLNAATWIAQDAVKRNSSLPSIVNLSLSGSKSEIINSAMNAMVDAGLIVVVAVGNSKIDACSQSPASATNPVKVAASDNNDIFSSFSNYGSCVDVIAPGSMITSSGPYNKQLVMSGTSMASPAVAGVLASALAYGVLKPEVAKDPYQLKYYLNHSGKAGGIQKVPKNTPNVLVQNGYDERKCSKKFVAHFCVQGHE